MRKSSEKTIDDGVLPLHRGRGHFSKNGILPDYRIYVAVQGREVIGIFSLAVMDNLAHLEAKTV